MHHLPELPYAYDALEPVISKKIMKLHHDKHHAGYVAKLNAALEGTEWADKPLDDVLQNLNALPEDKKNAVRNNGGGHANHTLFWEIMRAPQEDNAPTENVAQALETSFGGFDAFASKFEETATGQFGSGWAWLVKKGDGSLDVYGTANQDSPISQGDTPILGIDVWEHAYYLDYMNDRAAYVKKWWNVVNWDKVAELLK